MKLLDADPEAENLGDEGAWRDVVQRLPPLAFEVARETKELVQTVDGLGEGEMGTGIGEEDDDDF